jgi:hypothetical protein
MRPAIHNASARQNSGEPLSVIGQASGRNNGPRRPAISAEDEIAELADRPTHQLRLSWRKLYRREPPLGQLADAWSRYCSAQPVTVTMLRRAAGAP